MQTEDKISKRIYQLDALKFWASIIIVFHHYQQVFPYKNSFINFGSGKTIYWGYSVELFFMISGFLMGMRNERNMDTPFGRFIGKRTLRLLPLTFIAVLVDAILRYIYRWKVGEWFRDGAVSIWMLYKNLFLLQAGGAIPASLSTRLDPPIWYVSVLLLCYVIYWVLLWLSQKLGVNYLWLFLGVVMLSVGGYCYGINLLQMSIENWDNRQLKTGTVKVKFCPPQRSTL